jgi:hypothetical protein
MFCSRSAQHAARFASTSFSTSHVSAITTFHQDCACSFVWVHVPGHVFTTLTVNASEATPPCPVEICDATIWFIGIMVDGIVGAFSHTQM